VRNQTTGFDADKFNTRFGAEGRDRAAALERVRLIARLLDTAFRVPGTNFRFGFDGIMGLVPGLGDAATGVVALWLVYEAHRAGAPSSLIGRMLANVAIDTVVGSVPVLGDLFDVAFKANLRNMRLLEQYLSR
jgi:hypothetical protein